MDSVRHIRGHMAGPFGDCQGVSVDSVWGEAEAWGRSLEWCLASSLDTCIKGGACNTRIKQCKKDDELRLAM